jgi:hypothetical protein
MLSLLDYNTNGVLLPAVTGVNLSTGMVDRLI